MAMLDVALNIYERIIEVKFLIDYHNCEDTTWFWVTIACFLLPAVIAAVTGIVWAIKDRDWDGVAGAAAGLIFPVTSLIM